MTALERLIAGNRLHLNHGPIDLIIGAEGEPSAIDAAYRAAAACFPAILPGLVGELPMLRTAVRDQQPCAEGVIARRMVEAVWPYRDRFVTPMAAVAGSVADHVLSRMLAVARLRRAYVNNGGDVAIHLASGETFTVGVVGDIGRPAIDASAIIRSGDGIGGIATSGWRGRSQSLGIADAVTVLARDAASADAAATMIANAVNVDDRAVVRRPAREIKVDSDLGDLPVTTAVGPLGAKARRRALASGAERAREIVVHGLVNAAYIQLQGEMVVVGEHRLIADAA